MSSTAAPSTSNQAASLSGGIGFDEFLARLDEDAWMEWVDGEVFVMTPASAEHQRVRDFLLTLMRLYVEQHQLGEVFSSPFVMRLPARPSGREPDLLFIAAEHLDRLQATYLDGPADLVVEIISPESDARDRGEKFVEYEMAGIPEYWLIDPLRSEVFFFGLGQDGHYHQRPVDAEGVYRAAVLPGFWLKVSWLWQRPLPAIIEVMRQVVG